VKTPVIVAALCAFWALGSCGRPHAYDASIRQLDSLRVVLDQAGDNFSRLDSAKYAQALSLQVNYSTFITAHVQDTLNKADADALRESYAAGKIFRGFLNSRHQLREETSLNSSQLKKLAQDLKSNALDQDKAVAYMKEETAQAEQLIVTLKQNTDILYKQLEVFNRHLPAIETLVKRYNAGVLPPLNPVEL